MGLIKVFLDKHISYSPGMIKMTRTKWFLLVVFSIVLLGYLTDSSLSAQVTKPVPASDHYRDGVFYNSTKSEPPTFSKTMEILGRYVTEDRIDPLPKKTLPVKPVTRKQLDELDNESSHLIKLGHSSVLIKSFGKYLLIDPVFSDRASPFSFMGPKRFHPTPIKIKELPEIDKVIISHNHYDHFDKEAIKQLAGKTKQFLMPLGIEGDLEKWGVDLKKVISFDWWQEYQSENTLFAFTPTQHFSGRGLRDRNKTLWGSWVIKTPDSNLYFSGDSGYFEGFKTIGDKYGPFDFTFIETGAYNKDWGDIHMFPERSVKAHIDLKGDVMVPVHNSTFDLSFHPWYEPLDRVYKEAQKLKVSLSTPITGEVFNSETELPQDRWWNEYK